MQPSPVSRTTAEIDSARTATARPDIAAALQITVAAKARATEAWPGFDTEPSVLIAVFRPDGPIYVIGDSAIPSGYRWLDRSHAIAVREGTPPDSLLGLQISMDWDGQAGSATAVTFTGGEGGWLPLALLHEAFHTHQQQINRREPQRFARSPNPTFPDTSSADLALLNLEAAFLAQAVTSSDRSGVQLLARTALAVRKRRCERLGEVECGRERAMELTEGTATYVTSWLLDRTPSGNVTMTVRDSLARELTAVRDLSYLERYHFYNSGHAWLLLLEQLAPPGWKQQVEFRSPDVILAEMLELGPRQADSLFEASQATAAWAEAHVAAQNVFTAEVARRDSVERAFWNRPGVPFRVHFGAIRSVATGQGPLADGRIEYTYNFGANRVYVRGAARAICCPGVMTIVPTANRSARVDGRPVALDRIGAHDAGVVEIELPELTLRMERASLRVYRDSVTITSMPQ